MSWMVGAALQLGHANGGEGCRLARIFRFADDRIIAELRVEHPERRARSLAPVSIVDDVSLLPSLSKGLLDYTVDYHLLMDEDRIYRDPDTTARLLLQGMAGLSTIMREL
jgi:hypothetical protein